MQKKRLLFSSRLTMSLPKPSKDKDSSAASSSSQVTFVRIFII